MTPHGPQPSPAVKVLAAGEAHQNARPRVAADSLPIAARVHASWQRSALRAAFVAALLVGLLLAWMHSSAPPLALHGTPLQPKPAPGLSLQDTQGQRFHWANMRGKAVLVFFGYTHCPDVCPLTLAALAQTLQQLGTERRRVGLIFVTLDPQRDTPEVLRKYLDAFDPQAIGLRGSLQAVALAARDWGITWRRVQRPDGQTWIDHTAAVTLVGPHGNLRARYGYAQLANPATLAADLRALLQRE